MSKLIIDRLDDLDEISLSGIHHLEWRIKIPIRKKLPDTLTHLITYTEDIPDVIPESVINIKAPVLTTITNVLPSKLKYLELESVVNIEFLLPDSLEVLFTPKLEKLPEILPKNLKHVYCDSAVIKNNKNIPNGIRFTFTN